MSCRFNISYPSTILEDTRQQAGKHKNIQTWMTAHGVKLRRSKLFCGDYTLPADQHICIDTKYGLQEVYGDLIGHDHARFIRELDNAKDCGITLVILVEERGIKSIEDVALWLNPRIAQYNHTPKLMRPAKPPISSEQLMKVMRTVAERHGCIWKFCKKSETGKRICDILQGREPLETQRSDGG